MPAASVDAWCCLVLGTVHTACASGCGLHGSVLHKWIIKQQLHSPVTAVVFATWVLCMQGVRCVVTVADLCAASNVDLIVASSDCLVDTCSPAVPPRHFAG